MPVILQSGEMLESQHKVSTRFGNGTLHVTNQALIIEIKKKGIAFHRWHRQMAGIEARGLRTIKVKWPEGSQMQEFEFKARGNKDIVKRIKAKHDYARNFSADGASRAMFDEKQRESIRNDRAKWAEKELKGAEKRLSKAGKDRKNGKITDEEYADIKADTESWRDMSEHARSVACVRSLRVPESVADHLVWHDAWTDGNYFYTFCRPWSVPELLARNAVPDGEKDDKTGAYQIPAKHIRFFHGYPYVRGDRLAQVKREVGALIPAMTDEMLDDGIIGMCWRPRHKFENNWGPYETEPDKSPPLLAYMNELGNIGAPNNIALTKREADYLHQRCRMFESDLAVNEAVRLLTKEHTKY
ncbi:MAG: hypothetical protein J4F28_09395 [Nitrosopumilaceae archaeon]|nr:hypothetical protein [Nitrosopumilaceae archaeon]